MYLRCSTCVFNDTFFFCCLRHLHPMPDYSFYKIFFFQSKVHKSSQRRVFFLLLSIRFHVTPPLKNYSSIAVDGTSHGMSCIVDDSQLLWVHLFRTAQGLSRPADSPLIPSNDYDGQSANLTSILSWVWLSAARKRTSCFRTFRNI